MDFSLTEDHLVLQDMVRNFAKEEIAPKAEAIDAEGRYPEEIIAQMAELGLMGIAVPEQWGGSGMDPLAYVIAMEEISAACASCGVIMSVNNSLVCDILLKFANDQQKEKYLIPLASGKELGCFSLSEPGTGSDAASQKTVAVDKGDHFIINGSKNFITNGQQAATNIVFAMEDKEKRHKGISAFIVESKSDGYKIDRNEKKLGIKGSSTSLISLEDVKVPKENRIGNMGDGFKIAMTALDGGRIGIATQALGIARAAYDAARMYSLEREAFGSTLSQKQAIQFMLADMAVSIDAARLLIHRSAYLKGAKKKFSKESAMAKLFASEMSSKVTHKAIQIHGGYGYCRDFPVERHYRDARITEIYEGTSEVQRIVIANHVIKEAESMLG